MDLTKSRALSSFLSVCIFAVDHVAPVHDISLSLRVRRCCYELRRHILMSAILEMEAAFFCLSALFHTLIKIHSKWSLGVTMTLNTMTLFPITLLCPIVQNSPKRPYSKSGRNQMREKSIPFLSPLSLAWLNYWNKMLHLEESLERKMEKGRAGRREKEGETYTLLGTWVPFRLGPSSHRKPLKAVNDPLHFSAWEVG